MSAPLNIQASYDVVILGGGPAGLAAAIAVRTQLDVSVLVIERQTLGLERVGENCPPETLLLLQKMGLASTFYRDGHQTCPGYASVWGRTDVGYNDFIVNPMGPSWRLNRKKFDHMLATRAEALGAHLIDSTRFLRADNNEAEQHPYTLCLTTRHNQSSFSVTAGFVIDASGFKAVFAQSQGISKSVDDELFATVRFARISHGHSTQQVHLEAIPQGWCYHTALPEDRLVSMMVTEKNSLPALREEAYLGFETALRNTTFIGPRLKKLTLEDCTYQIYPIHSGRLPIVEGNTWMAIGDAAISVDPIAAQGVYKALSQGLMAGEKVLNWHHQKGQGGDFSAAVTRHYEIYKKNRTYVYSLEQRWPQAQFWRNRKAS